MQRFESWKEIEPTATEAERKLKAAVEAGEFCRCGPDGQTPPEPDDWSNLPTDRHIRADVLRFFLLGVGNDSLGTELGTMLTGALISGNLELGDCEIPCNMLLNNCRFQLGINATRCSANKNIRLNSCKLLFFDAAGLRVKGQLECDGTEFNYPPGLAINLQNANIGETFFLRSATIYGNAHLHSLQVSDSIECDDARFHNPGRIALNLQCANIRNGLIFTNQARVRGVVDVAAGYCGDLVDDPAFWLDCEYISLNGFTYHRIIGPTDARTRLNWLAKGDTWNGEFFPQPYKQLAEVLHDMGHEADATKVRVALGKKLRHHARKERIANAKHPIHRLCTMATAPALWIWHSLSLLLTGHGFRPERSLIALVFLWGLATIPAHLAWEEGSFAPNSAVALQSESWATYSADHSYPPHPNPAKDWSLTSTIGRDWESFNRYA
ncbi:hypothetical protein PhaeoP23_00558 [Phaeobacter piscinae]|uniref:Low-complexity protein n=1 Tax=Phaeobacter piscinae TaxID=1580596 RepID=A0ABM6PAZ6_9RHOB|nr:hypothetical protein [Phaeobacter piscinae]ATG34728.1 hypothetical protein PhaeoP36_00558 [Phaeobacter piscinae]AUQ85248.1 hypothetical protein PhaeoP42_00558 [Phaeobacter piscinae]AUR23132.1 hypothetical protein PhaeoP23_00558 [Phaeobacter piscinae]